MKEEAIKNREQIEKIKMDLALGAISYTEAKEMAEPIISSINSKACELAKKYGQKPQLVTFAALMR